jgi:succinate dehydrogenase / fumarate reductase flavoprotein subunit
LGSARSEYAAAHAKTRPATSLSAAAIDHATQTALAPFERGAGGENPFAVQHDLQKTMQDLVGIVRTESEMQEALTRLDALRAGPTAPALTVIASTYRVAQRS